MTEAVDERAETQEVDRQSLSDLFIDLADDGRDWFEAEVAVLRAEARRRLLIAAIALGLLALSAALVAGTLVALLVGIVFALSPVIGAGWATALVVLVALSIAAVSAQMGRIQLRRLLRIRSSNERNSGTRRGNRAA